MLQRMPDGIYARAWSGAYRMSGILAGGNIFGIVAGAARMRRAAAVATLN
jgi:hypothetical protein